MNVALKSKIVRTLLNLLVVALMIVLIIPASVFCIFMARFMDEDDLNGHHK